MVLVMKSIIPAVLTEISDQKDQGCCLAFALSDIVSMVMRISNKAPRAQPLIDSEALSVQKLLYVTTILGLESERTYPLVRVANEWNEELYRIRTHKLYKLNDLVYCDDPDLIKELIVAFDVLLYILVPEFEPNPVTSVTYCTTVYVALPPQTINPDYKGKDGFTLGPTLKKLKEANADGVLVKVLWGMVENDKRGEYQWSGYLELFEKLKKSDLKIQGVIQIFWMKTLYLYQVGMLFHARTSQVIVRYCDRLRLRNRRLLTKPLHIMDLVRLWRHQKSLQSLSG
ncbi:uncharacterized protein LOC143545270 [Bidens hawaiensis]|uniref:uncharacterized protein LOC143545270 n=1 Tax=Bidens hawaiensis TaxID=980011 RepID=UPI00404ADB2D